MKIAAVFLLLLLSCSCGHKVSGTRNNRYLIIMENQSQLCGFDVNDRNDTLRVLMKLDSIVTVKGNILIDEEVKQRVMDVVQQHLYANYFIRSKKKTAERGGKITFEIKSRNEAIKANSLTAHYPNIHKNADVSKEYSELIKYLKTQYKEFEKWPDKW